MSVIDSLVDKTLVKFSSLDGKIHKVYDEPVYEEYNGMYFVYFTTRFDGMTSFCKRYYQFVIGCYGIEIYYEDSNVIDIDKNYPLSDVRLKFKNRLNHLLKKLG